MINQNPLLGFTANSQVPRTWSLVQGWPLPVFYEKGFSDDIGTIVLPRTEKTMGTSNQRRSHRTELPVPDMGFSQSISLYITSFRETAKFPLHRSFQNIKQTSFFFSFFFFWFREKSNKN